MLNDINPTILNDGDFPLNLNGLSMTYDPDRDLNDQQSLEWIWDCSYDGDGDDDLCSELMANIDDQTASIIDIDLSSINASYSMSYSFMITITVFDGDRMNRQRQRG